MKITEVNKLKFTIKVETSICSYFAQVKKWSFTR